MFIYQHIFFIFYLGIIYRVTYKNSNYAMKQISRDDEFARTLFITESRCLSKLKHSSIIEFVDMLMDKKYYYLIMEQCDYDLYHIMKRAGFISEKKTKKIVYGLLGAIYYLHSKNVAHRDLKPENIVFHDNNTNQPILIDFGDAEMCKKGKMYDEFVGTPPYMSPERLGEHNGEQLKKADIWALAVIAYEMYSGKRCFEGDTQKQVFSRILKGEWAWPKDRVPSQLMMDFINKCLNINSQQRISAKDALQHPWFADIIKEQQNKLKNEEKQISDEVKHQHIPQSHEKIKLLVTSKDKTEDEEEEEEIQSPSPPTESLGDECPTDDHGLFIYIQSIQNNDEILVRKRYEYLLLPCTNAYFSLLNIHKI